MKFFSLLLDSGHNTVVFIALGIVMFGTMLLQAVKSGHKFPWNESPEGKFWTTPTPERWTVGNEHNQVWGADLASAATIAPTHKFHRVTGTTGVDTITPPWTTFAGVLYLSFEGAVAVSAGGNVDIAFTSAANEIACLIYNPRRGKWSGGLINAVT